MEDSETLLPSLFCKEDESSLNDYKDENFELFSVSESDSEYAEMLMQREIHFQPSGDNSSAMNESGWFKCARVNTIKWIIDTTILFGFQFGTAYLSLTYFDRFCSRRSIDDGKLWAIRLLSVACLSLAAKMEENEVPALSEYHIDEYNFKGNVIQKMELLVLNTLEWNLNCVTPFAYLNYFIAKFFEEIRHNELVTRAGELTLAAIQEINVVEHRPSVIAAAAVLAAYDHQLTKDMLETKMNAMSSWSLLEKEQTCSCYNLMQETMALRFKTPKSVLSLNSFSASSVSTAILDNSTVTSLLGTKRRLNYNDHDQHCPLPLPKISKP